MNIKIYVEGGDSGPLRNRCREGFAKLIEKAGFAGHMPRIVACGGRDEAFESFKTAIESSGSADYILLLVDSEDPVAANNTPWNHLRHRPGDNWIRPQNVSDDQAQLMATCMETWIMADRAALLDVFGAQLQESALLSETDLEQYGRHQVQQALEHATRNCGERAYKKGKRSFQVLKALNPNTLKQRLPHFKRFIETLEMCLR